MKKLHLDGNEIAKAVRDYLIKKGHTPVKIGLFAEAAEANESQPTFWAIAEVDSKEKKT